jgi:hypothetical protein
MALIGSVGYDKFVRARYSASANSDTSMHFEYRKSFLTDMPGPIPHRPESPTGRVAHTSL